MHPLQAVCEQQNLLGRGSYRNVYRCPETKTVVKKAYSGSDSIGENKREIEIWNFVKGTAVEKYFLPILEYSQCQTLIRMPFSRNASAKTMVKRQVIFPKFAWNDMHSGNFGWYKGRIVFRDYGDFRMDPNILDESQWRFWRHSDDW